tara:strand:- start:265 stop:852 length:588 start_codon:yes stop_codon:yes gene_type:complete
MKIQQELTQDQLAEFKELAKTKTWKEIASHFHIRVEILRLLRKNHPEIDIIYKKALKKKRNKIYTTEELLEIEELLETSNMESIVRYLGISMPVLTKARNNQPELEAAIKRGVANRSNNFNFKRKNEKRIQKEEKFELVMQKDEEEKTGEPKKEESLLTRVFEDISQEEAIIRFNKLKAEEKKKRQIQELRKMNW